MKSSSSVLIVVHSGDYKTFIIRLASACKMYGRLSTNFKFDLPLDITFSDSRTSYFLCTVTQQDEE